MCLGGIGPACRCARRSPTSGRSSSRRCSSANETQEQSLGLVFRYADQKGLPLLDLSDLRALLTFLASDEGKAELTGIGGLASQTVGVLLRALVGLEDGGGNEFFGEPMFQIADLLRTAPDGRGVISCLELPAVQDKPKLFSTALMWMLAELFEELPEVGDLDKPKLVFFFDEAHLLFDGATKAFVESVTQTVRLIRSKGVGVFFITQAPKDIPDDVLGQLGNRIQHALRAFTPDDAEALRADREDVSEVRVLRHRDAAHLDGHRRGGRHHPLRVGRADARRAHAARPPRSRMGPTDDVDRSAKASPLYSKYGTRVDNQSARELLAARMAPPAAAPADAPATPAATPKPSGRQKEAAAAAGGGIAAVGKFLTSRQGQAIEKQLVRGIFGMLKKR